MVLNILPCLYKNSIAETTGIFRIALIVQQYQLEINAGIIPNFTKLINTNSVHTFTGLLSIKQQLRFMITPIIPETHYEAFIDIGKQLNLEKRIEQLTFVIKSLSSTSVLVLAQFSNKFIINIL